MVAGEHVLPEAAAFPDRRGGLLSRMASGVSRLFQRKAAPKPSAGVELFLDAEKLSRHFGAAKQGRDDGVKDWPPVDAEQLGDFEGRVRGRTNDALARLKTQTIAILTDHQIRLDAIDIGPIGHAIERVENAAEQDFKVLRDDRYDPLVRLRSLQLLREREYRHFRLENARIMSARPESPMSFVIGLLVLMIIAEGILNAVFFQEMSSFGLIGGFVLAGAISALNIIFCFSMGRFVFRNLIHVKRTRRFFAWVGVIFIVPFVIFFHYTLARIRAIFEGLNNSSDVVSQHMPNLNELYAVPAHWTLMSGLLLPIGLLFSAVAILDGAYLSGEPYPGYGDVSALRERASRSFETARKKLYDDARNLIETAKSKIDAIVNEAESKLLSFSATLHEFGAVLRVYEQNATQMETACDRVIQTYREANLKVRTQTPPRHFDTFTSLDRNIGTDIDDATGPLKRMNETVDNLKEEAELAKNRLHKLLEGQLRQLDEDLQKVDAAAATQAALDGAVIPQAAELKI